MSLQRFCEITGLSQGVSVALRKAGMAANAFNREQTVHLGGGRGRI